MKEDRDVNKQRRGEENKQTQAEKDNFEAKKKDVCTHRHALLVTPFPIVAAARSNFDAGMLSMSSMRLRRSRDTFSAVQTLAMVIAVMKRRR